MPATRRPLAIVLVVGVALGCSSTSTPSLRPSSSTAPASTPVPIPTSAPLLRHEVIAGPEVSGAFDLATDGVVIAWSGGTVDIDAPALWSLNSGSGSTRLVYRSRVRGAILANVAVRRGTYAFAEVTPRADGSRTWRLVLVDPAGHLRILDSNDVPPSQSGVLPMAAMSDLGVLWATTHAGASSSGGAAALACELRYAPLDSAPARIVRSGPCSQAESWYPRSDARQFVYGTVEYEPSGHGDERHVYVVTDDNLDQPRRLDPDGEASLPAILDDTVVWKAAPRDLNMFNPNEILALSLAPGSTPQSLPLRSPTAQASSPQLTTPSIGPGFVAADDLGGGEVVVWDRMRRTPVDVDRLGAADPGFLSGARLAGSLLAWFYTSSSAGGGMREIRWLALPAG